MGGHQDDDYSAFDARSLARLMRTSVVSRPEQIWRAVLGLSAFFELLSYALPYFFLPSDDEADAKVAPERNGPFAFLQKPKEVVVVEAAEREWSMSAWLDDRRYMLGVLFSALWFVHSFVSANAARHTVLRRRDREALLGEDGGGADDEEEEDTASESDEDDDDKKKKKKKKGKKGDTSNAKDIKDRGGDNAKKEEEAAVTAYDDMAYSAGGSWGVFVAKCLWYLLLLPVGFYMLSLLDLRDIFFGDGGRDDTASAASSSGASAEREDLHLEASDDVASFGNRVATKQTRYCLAYATFVYVGQTASTIAGMAVRTRTVAFAKKAAKRTAKFAVRNPRVFKRRLKKALTTLRWAKYLAPLIGTGNKLLGNTKDLLKKYRQSRRAAEAKRVRRELWTDLGPEERLERATVLIQANYRAHRVRRTQSALRLLRLQRRDAAILRIQSILRRRAAAARVRVMRKKQELRELQMKQLSMKKKNRRSQRRHMSTDERRRIYQLQDELGIEFQKTGTGMLLRPNTKFAVTWKVLFVVCVVLEISNLAVKPTLAKYKDEETGKPLTGTLVLEHKFVPDPVETWVQCRDPSTMTAKGRKKTKKREAANAASASTAGHYGPWYCGEPWRTALRWFSASVRFVVRKAVVLIGLICFMDVFVTFFTGELDEETGMLGPKPFFTRWLLPGLLLQLLVNPMMADVAAALHRLRRGVHHVGPARVYRWTEAFVLPAFGTSAAWFEWNVWRRFVKEKNAEIVKDSLIE